MERFSYKEYIKKHFTYHSDGSITRDDRKNSDGSLDKDGYLILKIKGKQFKAHRVVWLLNYGYFPKDELDHINRNRTDNRVENLRVCSRAENNRNKNEKINKDTGYQGVYIDKSTKGLKAVYSFKLNGKTYRFRTLNEAVKMKEALSEQISNDSKES